MNFTACKIAFETNATNLELYSYTGPVHNLPLGPGRPYLISEHGCRTLCGTGAEKYPWATAANTITTWVLPIIGLLLQAPFESNQVAKTFLAACRWIGAPIASLSYIFWNIKITGKCAITVDMAVDYSAFPGPGSEFSQLRDSFYILSVMNQYALSVEMDRAPDPSSTERFLRVALFDNELALANPDKGMVHRREKLAASLRSGRKRGVVPIFISTLWFLLSLAISIHAAFGNLGVNATAHNLAIGLLLGWLPVLTLSSITDRSPGSADDVRRKLNRFLAHAHQGLQADTTNPRYKGIQLPSSSSASSSDHPYPYFTAFCGQARSRWHYGIAHAILTGTEDAFAAAHGRNWTAHHNARALLVSAPPATRHSNIWFDFRELWQILGATALVACSVFGSFIISYFTPTVGLGCRSGGYLIFFVLTLAHFLAESGVWWCCPRPSRTRDNIGWAFTALEIANTAWLIYILTAQTFGLYQTCACWSSSWGVGSGGGYINFGTSAYYRAHIIAVYWTTGTILSSLAMGAGFLYVVAEWCTQSHMWTEDYGDAMAGLKATRRFKKYTIWFRCVSDWVITKFKTHRPLFLGEKKGRRSLVWRWKTLPA